MACSLGVAHPPGYPLLTLLGRGWLSLPIPGSPALQLSLFSAVCGTLAAAVLGHTGTLLSPHAWGSSIPAVLWALSGTTWKFSTHFEVFSLNNLFVAVLLHAAVRFHISPSKTTLYSAAFLCGLGLSNQHTLVLFEAPLILSVLVRSPRLVLRNLHITALLFLLGLTPYVLLVLRAGVRGAWGGTDNWAGFWDHVARAEYGSLRLYLGLFHSSLSPYHLPQAINSLASGCGHGDGLPMSGPICGALLWLWPVVARCVSVSLTSAATTASPHTPRPLSPSSSLSSPTSPSSTPSPTFQTGTFSTR